MGDIIVSAPGKVILHGEHAVVYGKKAVASSLNLRTFLKLSKNKEQRVSISLPDINVATSWDIEEIKKKIKLPLCKASEPSVASEDTQNCLRDLTGISKDADTESLAMIAFMYLYCGIAGSDRDLPPLCIHLSSSLPTSAGLGSSAAYSVCLASSLLLYSKCITQAACSQHGDRNDKFGRFSEKDLELINGWAFQAEKLIHGNPSGIDNSVSSYGGALIFQNGAITKLKTMPQLSVMLTNTKVPRSTKVLVAGVRQKYNKYPNIIGPVLDSIEGISHKFVESSDDVSAYSDKACMLHEELIDMNQHFLNILGVGHPSLDKVCQITAKYGLHSKLTGAGGGGCAFTLLKPGLDASVIKNIKEELSTLNFDCWETSVGGHGVIQHFQLDGTFQIPKSFNEYYR